MKRHKSKSARDRAPARIVWKDVALVMEQGKGSEFCSVEFYHHWVLEPAIAGILDYDWVHKPGRPVKVRLLRLHPSFPIKVVKRVLTDTEANTSPQVRQSPGLRAWIDRAAAKVGGLPRSKIRSDLGREPGGFLAQDRPEEWERIVAEVKEAVEVFLRNRQNGRVTERVSCWINA